VARIRTIKPSFWGDGAVSRISHGARLLMIGLISMADDEGRFLASPAAVAGYVFPNDDLTSAKIRRWMKEIEDQKLVHLYSIDGLHYGCFLGWKRHQVINRPQRSHLPPPQGVLFE
jgi:hypothetical protein